MDLVNQVKTENEHIHTPYKIIHRTQIFLFVIYFCIISFNFIDLITTSVHNMTTILLVISIVVFLVIWISTDFVHEYSHFAVAKMLKHKCKVHLGKKPYIEFLNDLPKNDFIFIAITPLLIHIIQFYIYMYFFPFNLFFGSLFLLPSAMGCMSDLHHIYRVLGYDGKSVVFRFKERGTFEVVPIRKGDSNG